MNMKRTKKIYIELNEGQKEKLEPLFNKVLEAAEAETPVMLLAQIHFDFNGTVAVCGIIDHETGIKMQELMGMSEKKIGKAVGGYKHIEELTKKARS